MALAAKIPHMTDDQLTSLRANAQRLSESGAPAQQAAAVDILPVIDAEIAEREALAPPKKTPVRKTPVRKAAAKAPAKPRGKKAVAAEAEAGSAAV